MAHFWGVCGKSVPARVRFFFAFGVCVSHEKRPTKKKGGGGRFWWNLRLVKIQVFIHPEWYKGRSYLCDVTLYAYKVFQRGEISKLVFFYYHTVNQLRCLISIYASLVGRICYFPLLLQRILKVSSISVYWWKML